MENLGDGNESTYIPGKVKLRDFGARRRHNET
jgi:hypothetical protein